MLFGHTIKTKAYHAVKRILGKLTLKEFAIPIASCGFSHLN